MDKYNVGDVCLFFEGKKNRPIVIVQDGLGLDIDVSIARVTTAEKRNKFDVIIKDWKQAKLKEPSIVRCSKVNTIKPTKYLIKIGTLSKEDAINVVETVKLYFEESLKKLKS